MRMVFYYTIRFLLRRTMSEPVPNFRLLSILFLCVFGGAIVGETVALSMVISVVGPGVLGKLYLINGFLLFLLPPLFFNNIDRFNRGRLLSFELIVVSFVLLLYLVFLTIVIGRVESIATILLYGIYPLSYLTKIVLFLTFWTLANDVCFTREAKKEFPKILHGKLYDTTAFDSFPKSISRNRKRKIGDLQTI